jgi:hypothetical protein
MIKLIHAKIEKILVWEWNDLVKRFRLIYKFNGGKRGWLGFRAFWL